MQAGLLSASSRGIRPWEFIVVRDRNTLKYMAGCRVNAANMLENADCAIVVIADEAKSDVWIEDSAIAMANMHLMADSMGIGSCWIQGRLRYCADGKSTEEYLREIFKFPKNYKLEAVLSLGMPESKPTGYDLNELPTQKVHFEKF